MSGLPSTTDKTLTAEVPAAAVTERGAQYYVRLNQQVGEDTLRATAPPQVPARLGFVQTQVEQTTAPGAFRAESYRMISVPLDLSPRTVREVLTDQYGTYNRTEWRLLRWSPTDSTYQENDQIRPPLSPGRAAWLITDEGDPLVVQKARSIPSGSPDTIALQPGWNQLGNPFPFPVAWKEVEGTDAVAEIAEFDGTRPQGNYYRFDVEALRPWRGYFVLNTTGTKTFLVVPPRGENPSTLASHDGASSSRTANSPSYHLRAVTRVPWGDSSLVDRQAQMGFQSGAVAGVGPEDTQKPPSVGPHVRVAITPTEGPALVRSWKPVSGQGARWNLSISLWPGAPAAATRSATIRLDERGARPDGFRHYVLDLDHGKRLPVTHGTVTVEEVGATTPRHLRVIVGTEAFAHQASGSTSLTFERTRLLANVPNPFRQSTTISYQLAEPEHVTIRVYDILGRLVETLVDGGKPAGVHEVTWQTGGMASGVYVCRMQVGKNTSTRKMTLVR